jgi:hypothetical protein
MADVGLDRIGLQHARPDLRFVKQIKRASMDEPSLVLKPEGTDLAIQSCAEDDVA